jgi:hypothetical protein
MLTRFAAHHSKAHMDTQHRLAWQNERRSGLPVAARKVARCKEGRPKVEAPKRQGHAMGQPQHRSPTVARSRQFDLVASILAFEGRYRVAAQMCDGLRVEANQWRASDSRSRLAAWLATGVPCALPGRDLEIIALFRSVARSAQAFCAQWSFSKAHWLLLSRFTVVGRGEERRGEKGGDHRRTLMLLGRQLP